MDKAIHRLQPCLQARTGGGGAPVNRSNKVYAEETMWGSTCASRVLEIGEGRFCLPI
jgi:hypothetical protein